MGDRLMILVRDISERIFPDQLPRVFDRSAKLADSEGSRLGRAVAKRMVEAHTGTIDVESVEGVDATFTIRLPIPETNHFDIIVRCWSDARNSFGAICIV